LLRGAEESRNASITEVENLKKEAAVYAPRHELRLFFIPPTINLLNHWRDVNVPFVLLLSAHGP